MRDEKLKVLEAIVPPAVAEVAVDGRPRAVRPRGRPAASRCPAYREEEGVAPDSRTETYAALRLHVSNWRWAGRAVLPAHRQAAGAQG